MPEIRVPAWLNSGERSLPRLPPNCPHMAERGREGGQHLSPSIFSSFNSVNNPTTKALPSLPNLTLITFQRPDL